MLALLRSSVKLGRSFVVEESLNHALERSLVHAEIILGRGLDVSVPGKLLNKGYVGAVVQQVGAVGMPKNVRGHGLIYPRLGLQPLEGLGKVVAIPTPW